MILGRFLRDVSVVLLKMSGALVLFATPQIEFSVLDPNTDLSRRQ